MPVLGFLRARTPADGAGEGPVFFYQATPRFHKVLQQARHAPIVLDVVQNAQNGLFDPKVMSEALATKASRQRLIDGIENMVLQEKAQGVCLDFENLPESDINAYLQFIREIRDRFKPKGLMVTLTVEVEDRHWPLRAMSDAADKVFVMDYDEHALDDPPGPIASQDYFVQKMNWGLSQIPPSKAIMTLSNYAYNWTEGKASADSYTVGEAWLLAHDSEAKINFDPASHNPYFFYEEEGKKHTVWFMDAVSAWNQLKAVDNSLASGVALWRLGAEDPSIWNAFEKFQGDDKPDLDHLNTVGNVDVEGAGEIIHIDEEPSLGSRRVRYSKAGMAEGETYDKLPTPYVVRRLGNHPGEVALTFDDGPDPIWTPKIAKILKDEGVTATFFIVGEKALLHWGMLNSLIDQGHELGSHTYTHPNLAETAIGHWPGQEVFELNSTQRVIEAYTGRSVRLFRAPFFGDAEPTTDDELKPAATAQRLGYINVGLHVDSEDWQKPGVQAIIDNVINGVHGGTESLKTPECLSRAENCRTGQIVLLHDSGGERDQTVAALPTIIKRLKAEGYRFVNVSQLAGFTRNQAMPHLQGNDLLQVRFEMGIFMFLALLQKALGVMFIVAIILGISRALILAGLAVYAYYFGKRTQPPLETEDGLISVIIPAYNEAKVIETSVRRVLTSEQVRLEIIVVDDGSKDETSTIVANAFKDEPRVKLLTIPNGGKAHAVNQGLAIAKGKIIITLDADTQFEKLTISRLVRWFSRPEIGAVAGNAKVGNRFNWVTKWQAVEYVTAQNLEREALGQFDAIMVVPGAVGAWRRAALDAVGGYPLDTLAEDQDLTIAIQRKGWKIAYDLDAVAWTEAPESFTGLIKQRYRWAFGTLQCLWKHRSIYKTAKPEGLALIGIPQAWVFQIGFAVISPLIDFALVVNIVATFVRYYQHGWVQAQGDTDIWRMLAYWIAFITIDVICGAIAFGLEPREKSYPVFRLISQRFIYRQLMYYVVLKALKAALEGPRVGWNKLERSGRHDSPGQSPEPKTLTPNTGKAPRRSARSRKPVGE